MARSAFLHVFGQGDSRRVCSLWLWTLIKVTNLPVLILCSVAFIKGRGVYLVVWAVEQRWFRVNCTHGVYLAVWTVEQRWFRVSCTHGVYLEVWTVEQRWFRVSCTRCLLLGLGVKPAASDRVAMLPSMLLSGNSALLVTLQLGGRFSSVADCTCGWLFTRHGGVSVEYDDDCSKLYSQGARGPTMQPSPPPPSRNLPLWSQNVGYPEHNLTCSPDSHWDTLEL